MTTRTMMRWLVLAVVLGVGACGGDPLVVGPDASDAGADTGAAADGATPLPSCTQVVTATDNCLDPPGPLCCSRCYYGDFAGELHGCAGVLASGAAITCAAAPADCPAR